MRKIERLLDELVATEGDAGKKNAGFDWAEKKGGVITVWGVGGTVWKLHWLCPHWYWERDTMAAHPVDQRTERHIRKICKEELHGEG